MERARMDMRQAMERKSPVYLRVSDAALQEAADIEGFVPYAYDDKDPKSLANKTFITPDLADTVEGTLTIGYGHTRTVKPGQRVTKEEALRLLRSDARDAESCVHRHVNVPLTQGEFDGLWDLFFNVGPGRMRGANGPDDMGRDGIACLGKTGNGRPSTLLSVLNDWKEDGSNYTRAAECFTQWRSKGTVWEWGLTKRRIRFMLMFMNLPIVRAMVALPNAMPPTDQARHELVQHCVALARDEAGDAAAMLPPPPAPELPEIVLDKPLPPPPPPEVKPALPPKPVPPPVVVVAPPPKPAPPPPPPVSAKPPPEPEKVEAKNPLGSQTIWGGLLTAIAPELDKIGNTLMGLGATMGPAILTLGLIMIVLGRIGATQPLSTSASIRKSS